ncbi:MAG: hypothetical protein II295_10500 [Akkermansia sp.]|jgi:hypothetical protein|nr:hypothetical protein [Akkermansia sp.]
MSARTLLTATTAALFLAVGSLSAATKVVLQDDHCKTNAVTYTLPKGWVGGGDVTWDAQSDKLGNYCVRTMQLVNRKEAIIANYISTYEVPLKTTNPDAMELASLLQEAARQLPGNTGITPVQATIYQAPQDVQDFRMARDTLREQLGKKVNSRVYVVNATYSDGTLVGAVVHERSIRKGFRTDKSVTFHDIFVLGSTEAGAPDARALHQALVDLSKAARNADFNNKWIEQQIRQTASTFYGMRQLDKNVMPKITKKAKEGMKRGLPTVLDCLYTTKFCSTQPQGTPVAAN